ncbi:tRNA threonylcarbamoyladenosine dehydratase [Treponema sp. OttesenSCG-928-L16]|nr:tRNA threonylcarbamoyladenosine dehydratase [Treponema sp. OttesenSCG-928-L16]
MEAAFSRLEMIIGSKAMEILRHAKVAVIGLGGVGSSAAEALARSGIGSLVLVDSDTVDASNLNRQLIALRSNIGRPKSEVLRERLLDINPELRIEAHQELYGKQSGERLLGTGLSYAADAIDTVSSKIDLILRTKEMGIPIISSMGTGNKLDPSRLEIADIYETSLCPLARVMRRELKARGVKSLDVVYSREQGRPAYFRKSGQEQGPRHIPGSSPFVPPAAGLLMASWIVRKLIFPEPKA